MSYSKKRIDYNNKWPDDVILFSGQLDFQKLLNEKGVQNILRPIQIPLIEDFNFQRLLSFKIDIYEQLPFRPDIAFDLAWRTFEAYTSYYAHFGSWNTTKTWKILNKTCEDILINQVNRESTMKAAIDNLFVAVPLQATEFLIRRLFEAASSSLRSQQAQIIERVKDIIGEDLFEAIRSKYGVLTPELQRKAGMLLQIMMSGQQVQIDNKSFQLNKMQILKLLINGLLYTYRNERFHGGTFSPFKSSKTQIKTYAHPYYCLIATYFFVAQLLFHHFPTKFQIENIAKTLEENNTRYNLVFAGHRRK